jgi:hypothetical protein
VVNTYASEKIQREKGSETEMRKRQEENQHQQSTKDNTAKMVNVRR